MLRSYAQGSKPSRQASRRGPSVCQPGFSSRGPPSETLPCLHLDCIVRQKTLGCGFSPGDRPRFKQLQDERASPLSIQESTSTAKLPAWACRISRRIGGVTFEARQTNVVRSKCAQQLLAFPGFAFPPLVESCPLRQPQHAV